ncbi:hypothetical protein SOVF_182450, partial [Spinacia oleracea]
CHYGFQAVSTAIFGFPGGLFGGSGFVFSGVGSGFVFSGGLLLRRQYIWSGIVLFFGFVGVGCRYICSFCFATAVSLGSSAFCVGFAGVCCGFQAVGFGVIYSGGIAVGLLFQVQCNFRLCVVVRWYSACKFVVKLKTKKQSGEVLFGFVAAIR